MAERNPLFNSRARAASLTALCIFAAAMIAWCAQPAMADASGSAEFFTSTSDGVARIFPNGSVDLMESISSGYSLELFNGNLYTGGGSDIRVYTKEGAYVKIINTPSNLSYLTFAVLPGERIALMNNEVDKVYFINSSGSLIATANIRDPADNTLQNLDAIVVNNALILSEDGDKRVLRIDLGTYQVSVFKDLSSIGTWIGHITYSGGNYYVCGPNSIYRFTETGNWTRVANLPQGNIVGIAVVDGYAYVPVNFYGKIYKVNLQNGNSTVFAEGLDYPNDIETTAVEAPPAASGIDPMLYAAIGVAVVAIVAAVIYFIRKK